MLAQEEEARKKHTEAPGAAPRPEDSRYYHPILNPTGAPPPGKAAAGVVTAPVAAAAPGLAVPVPKKPPLPSGPAPGRPLPPPPSAPPLPAGPAPHAAPGEPSAKGSWNYGYQLTQKLGTGGQDDAVLARLLARGGAGASQHRGVCV